MNENLEQEQRVDEPIQPFAGPPGAPGGTTATNFQNFPDDDINTYPGGAQAFFSRPGVCYNAGGAANIGQYANFTDGNSGFLIYSENGAPGLNLVVRKKSRKDTTWSNRYVLYHSGNFNTSLYASATSVEAKADKTYVDTGLASKASQSYVDNAVANKADKSALDAKADKAYVDKQIVDKSLVQCVGYVNNYSVSYNNGKVGFCSGLGTGSYNIRIPENLPSRLGVTVTPSASDSANISVSIISAVGSSFNVSITKNGTGFDCPFYFQLFGY